MFFSKVSHSSKILLLAFILTGCATPPSKPSYAPVITSHDTSKIVNTPSFNINNNAGNRHQNSTFKYLPPPKGLEDYTLKSSKIPSRHTDIWSRIRSGFQMQPLYGGRTEDKTYWYAGQADYLERMFGRSSRYMHYILHEVEKRGMPTEIALLPFVESAFNPRAYSHAAAAGMWQFIPSTGKNYNLSQNFFEDKRLDVIQSTNAALDYLTKLYEMFGDWSLALAAYNAGENRIAREIRKNEAAGRSTDYESLSLPKETKDYVPKLLAIKNLISQPDMYGISLPNIADKAYFEAIPINRDIDVQIAARLAQIDLDEFRNLNPAHKRPVITASTNAYILLPLTNATLFKRNLEKYHGPLSTWTTYTTYQNEPLITLAQRVGTTPYEIAQANNLSYSAQFVPAGRTLLIPTKSPTQNIGFQEVEYSDYGFAGSSDGFSLHQDYEY